ncbi:YqzK family protein [Sporolactobacillus sp. CPB3-1]|uniref:YqzK family protein n=1 Tax=Sporolactobacillus mangiferae TaxID=2940498 RepID=A0ABT0MAG9_9BACL|nr:DUF4227 family protein [Sporolactobacillus mangiferae]MCL1631877.1 YqzK family protein [Sporolactobacillus mangiferae]
MRYFYGIIDLMKICAWFVLFTAIFYLGMTWMDQHLEKTHRYDEPGSGAVKVDQTQTGKNPGAYEREEDYVLSRFFEFLRDGE